MAPTKGKPQAPVAEEVGAIAIDDKVIFLGYPEGTPDEDRILTEGAEYTVLALPGTEEVEGETVETGYYIQVPNPSFNPKKKPHQDTNPEFIEAEVFENEIELAGEGGETGEGEELPLDYAYLLTLDKAGLLEVAKENNVKLTVAQKKTEDTLTEAIAEALGLEPEAGEGEGEELPIDYAYLEGLDKPGLLALAKENDVKLTLADKKTEATLLAKLAVEFDCVPEAEVVEEAPAKPAAKAGAKAAAKAPAKAAEKAPAKGAAKATSKAPAKTEEPEAPEFPELENEDESVLALIEGAGNLVEVAQTLEGEVAANEYRLGGVLYHIKKAGDWKEVDPKYAENGGWSAFVQDHFNVDYRKAQYLIDIYVSFTQAGIENPSEVVGTIGWTKASKLCSLIAQDGADVAGLIELAETNTVADLSVVLKEQFQIGGTGGTPGETKTRVTLKFRYLEEQAKTIEDILTLAGEQLGGSDEDALYHILGAWAVDNNVEVQAAVAAEKEAEKAPAKGAAKAGAAKPAGRAVAAKPAAAAAKPAVRAGRATARS